MRTSPHLRHTASDVGPLAGEHSHQCWQVIALHYLGARPLERPSERWVAFSDFQEIRGYESVYKGRVLGRLCATAGRDRDTFTQACLKLGATPVPYGDVGFEFRVFPQLSVILAWYAGDEEFPPAASFLFPDDILARLPLEDTIVLTEAIVAYRSALRHDPAFFESYYNLGLAAMETGDLAQSLVAYEYALVIDPDSADARFNFALALQKARFPRDAADELERLLAGHPDEARAHLTLANVCARELAEPQRAREHYLRVLQLNPKHPQAAAIGYWLMGNP